MSLAGASLFRQTLVAVIGALLLGHLVVFVAVVLLPRSGSTAISVSDVVRQLGEPGCTGGNRRLAGLTAQLRRDPPVRPEAMSEDAYLSAEVASALGARPEQVRLFWNTGSDIRLARLDTAVVNGASSRVERAIFVAGAVFGRQQGSSWCVKTMPPPSWSGNWQWRAAAVTVVSVISMLPLAWLFARRLSRPIREFGVAADRIGRDSEAPLLQEQGPEELRQVTRALNDMQRRIQEQSRDRETMIAAIAHDLRTPLSRIAFRAETVPRALRIPIQQDIAQMKAMIEATIDHFRKERAINDTEPIDLVALLAQTVAEERATGHAARLNTQSPQVLVQGEMMELRRMFQNLIDNARKFGAPAEVTLLHEPGLARVLIADRGPGIDAERMEDMFRPFERGEPSRNRGSGGVGLGLAIARRIARRHGGQVTLANRQGGGLTVEVQLPAFASGSF